MGVQDAPVGEDSDSIVRGQTEKHYPQAVLVYVRGYGGTTQCSGTYFDERMVVTAGHCMRADAIPNQTFVYFGKDFANDKLALPEIPDPGKRSVWARAETSGAHPEYDPNLHHPDLAVLFLDRKLPFDPIPLDRHRLTSRDKVGTAIGWGGSKALTPDISQVEGAGIKRSADLKILGSPTEADFHPDDPNNGILDPAIRADLLKTDGRAPRANTCAGDSGGPLLVEEHGRDKLAAVNFWTGLSCEDYAMYTRVEPFLDYFDAQSKLNGDQKLTPRLECVEKGADGKYTARFGYKNENALSIYIKHGHDNDLRQDKAGVRPEAFSPGDNPYAFKVPFGSSNTVSWTLDAPGQREKTVTATKSSPACNADDLTLICGDRCKAELAAECSQDGLQHGRCVSDCVGEAGFFSDYFNCGAEWNTYLKCIGNVPPAAENWDCSFPGFPASPTGDNCAQELTDVYVCAGFI